MSVTAEQQRLSELVNAIIDLESPAAASHLLTQRQGVARAASVDAWACRDVIVDMGTDRARVTKFIGEIDGHILNGTEVPKVERHESAHSTLADAPIALASDLDAGATLSSIAPTDQTPAVPVFVEPVGDRLVVRTLAPADDQNVGGVFIPDAAKEKPQEAEVLAVGPGRYTEHGQLIPIPHVVGERVLHQRYAGNEVTVDGKTFLILRRDDVLAILRRGAPPSTTE